MPNDEIVNQEIKHPVEYHVPASARRIAEQLLRHDSPERRIEKVNDFRYYLRKLVHRFTFAGAKVQLFFDICK